MGDKRQPAISLWLCRGLKSPVISRSLNQTLMVITRRLSMAVVAPETQKGKPFSALTLVFGHPISVKSTVKGDMTVQMEFQHEKRPFWKEELV